VSSTDQAFADSGNAHRPGGNTGPALPRLPRQRNAYAGAFAGAPTAEAADIAWLRDLARGGGLGTAVATGQRPRLCRAAFAVSYRIVFDVVTRRLELTTRGHPRCARGIRYLDGPCLDSYYDDVEALIDYLMVTTKPIDDLEGWLVHWAPKAVIDGHRRRRGERGALQRPRMNQALAADLGDDPWLCELALKILVWVGVPSGAGADLWPLDRWAQMRAELTGDLAGSTPAVVGTEVEWVLTAMRRRPQWYENYVERPLGHKVAPVVSLSGESAGSRPLVTISPAEVEDARVRELAFAAVEAIRAGLDGHDPTDTVVTVLTQLFLGGTGADELDRVPSAGDERHQGVSGLLADPVALTGIVDRVLGIVRGESAG
jgi:hypothetical protein